ncbi:restriction endonuclease subunit S [Roseburia faecis]|uniref:restriction endonuclease subunit S n=1 Tax=Roseburia faecis TaxID=301302 RepID=UPI003F98D7F7
MNAQDLKNSILQLAVQGKLVEQRAEEGTARELLEQIKLEKDQLIKDKKIKKSKPLPEITEDEIPFEIPESWEWVRFGEIMNVVSARRVHQSDWKNEGIPFYRAREIAKLSEDGYVDNELFISAELYDELSKSGVPKEGDLMVTAVGTLGKTYIVTKNDKFYYKDASVICFENYAKLSPEYIKMLMETPLMNYQIKSNSAGTTVATLTMVRMNEYMIPLPPLEEQHRIVAKIEEILPYIDQYDKAYTKLETFNKKFPEDMKKSILQMAMQGKLVEQLPEEGTADELYEQIVAEKAQLIKDGKIKKEKPLPEIAEDEIPFEIPSSWKWVRWGKLSFSIQYGYNAPALSEGHYRMVRISDIQDNKVLWETVPYCKIEDKEVGAYLLEKNDILFARTGGTVGKSFLVKDVPYEAVYAGYLIRTRYNSERLVPEYLKFFMESQLYWQQLRNGTIATAQPNCNGQTLAKMMIPIPPLEEQHRIVAKIEELLPYCDQLIK